MITDILLQLFAGVIDWGLSQLPTWSCSLPSGVSTVVATAKAFDAYVPVTEVLACVALAATLVVALQAWKWVIKIIDWIADIIP
jgi:hypothetical protein